LINLFMNSEKNNPPVKIVFDTNVYISAILNKGKTRNAMIGAFASEDMEVLISEPILREIEKVLTLKFHRDSWEVSAILIALRQNTTLIQPDFEISVIKKDETDNRILECAVAGNAKYIISGDRHHIQPLIEYHGIRILTPAEFLNTLI
jgi:putative PIN family toxin of toxin-antitoxin system